MTAGWRRIISQGRAATRLLAILNIGIGAAVGMGCAKPADVTERGALLLRLTVPSGTPLPDELRVFAYDDGGAVFTNARVPTEGPLQPAQATGPDLGTVLIQPGASNGILRLHVRGFQGGGRILDGLARVPAEARASGRFTLALSAAIPADADGDDVPDLIDDCQADADPEQTWCGGASDGGVGGGAVKADGAVSTGGAGGEPAAGGQSGAADGGATGGGGKGGAGAPGSGGAGNIPGSGGSGGSSGGSGGLIGTGGRASSGGSGGLTGTGGRASSGGSGGASDGGIADSRPADAQAMEVAKKALGVACGAATECASAFCADGFCCQSACNDPCQACNNQGRCNDVTRSDDVPECSGTRTCNNRGACVND